MNRSPNCIANRIRELVANKSFEILSSFFSAVKKIFPKQMFISNATRRSDTHFTVHSDMDTRFFKSLKLITEQAWLQLNVIHESKSMITDSQFQITRSLAIRLLMRSCFFRSPTGTNKTALQGNRTPQVGNLDNKPASPQN